MPHDHDELRTQTWDLIYGLLSPEESKTLISRIKSDPQAARLYAEVRLQADLVGEAARIDDPALVPDLTQVDGIRPLAPAPQAKAAALGPAGWRAARWLPGVAAAALAAVLLLGFVWPRPDTAQIAARYLVTEVAGPPVMTAGVSTRVAVHTYRLGEDGQPAAPAAAEVAIELRDTRGTRRFLRELTTGPAGNAEVELPGAAIEPGVAVHVGARRTAGEPAEPAAPSERDADELIVYPLAAAAPLPVQQDPPVHYFLWEQPQPTRNQPVRFGLWSFTAFRGEPAPVEEVRSVVDPAGQLVWNQQEAAGSTATVVEGVYPAAPPLAGPPPAELALRSRQDAAPSSTLEKSAAPAEGQQAGQADARAADGTPPALEPRFGAAAVADASAATPALRERESLSVSQATSSVAAGQPVLVSIPLVAAGKPLTAVATCRGAVVATQAIAPTSERAGQAAGDMPTIALDLPPEAEGQIEIELLDPATNPPAVISRETVFRQPARRLAIAFEAQDRYAPGDEVELKLTVADERGQVVPGALVGVRVWNEAAVPQRPLLLADAVWSGSASTGSPSSLPALLAVRKNAPLAETVTQLAKTERRGESLPVGGAAADRPQRSADTDRSLAQLPNLPTSANSKGQSAQEDRAVAAGVQPFFADSSLSRAIVQQAAQPRVRLASNHSAVQTELAVKIAQAQTRQATLQRAFGATAILLGGVLAAWYGVLLARQILISMPLKLAGLAAAAASLLLGMVWLASTQRAQMAQLAMAERASEGEAAGTAAPAPPPESLALVPPTTGGARQLREDLFRRSDSLGDLAAAAPADAAGLAGEARDKPAVLNRADSEAGRGAAALQPAAPAAAGEPAALAAAPPAPATAPAPRAAAVPAPAAEPSPPAPTVLFFDPALRTGSAGQVTVRFTMPATPARYRLLVDTLAAGRIGSHEQTLVCATAGRD